MEKLEDVVIRSRGLHGVRMRSEEGEERCPEREREGERESEALREKQRKTCFKEKELLKACHYYVNGLDIY